MSWEDQKLEMQKQVDTLKHLLELMSHINSGMDIDDILRNLMDGALIATESEGASVLLWDQKRQQLYFAATDTDSSYFMGEQVPLEDSVAGKCFTQGKIVTIDDTYVNPNYYQQIDQEKSFKTQSIMAVPIKSKTNNPIGVLEVVNKRVPPWTLNDEYYLSAFTQQAALALENSQLISSLRRANDEISELDKRKNSFIAIASHELRTPLGIILGYISFLQEDFKNDVHMNVYVKKVMKSALHLRQIIDNLADLSYLQHSKTSLHLDKIHLTDILQSLYDELVVMSQAKRQQFNIQDVPHDLKVNADDKRINKVLVNVVMNAIELSPIQGNIDIWTEIHGKEVWIHIQDNGIGLHVDQLDRIFDKFYQVEDHETRHHQGLGIGLSMSKALIELHQGRIWAESEGLGKGSTFIVALPISED